MISCLAKFLSWFWIFDSNSTDADLILTDDDGEISKIVDQTDFESIQRISPVPLEVAIAEKKINWIEFLNSQ